MRDPRGTRASLISAAPGGPEVERPAASAPPDASPYVPTDELYEPGWQPTFDFVYFRPEKQERQIAGIILAGEQNMVDARVIAAGPGRMLPQGAMRIPPCKRGDYIRLNVQPGQGVTEFVDDDGKATYVVGSEFIVAVRSDKPPANLASRVQVAAPGDAPPNLNGHANGKPS